jgi:ketosteroid isomerase-like protein
MRKIVCVIVTVMFTMSLWSQKAKPAQDPALVAEVRQSIIERRAAAEKHDRATYAGYLADDVVFVDGDNGSTSNKAEILEGVASTDGPPETYSDPVDLTVWKVGDLIFANYRSVEIQTFGSQIFHEEFRGTYVFRRAASGLKAVFFQATLIPNTQREAAKIDTSVYDKYVGKYSAGPGDMETVTREGERLFLTLSGTKLELKPMDASTFYIEKLGDDWVFLRSDKGEVTGLESRVWGQNIRAKKIN